MLPSDELPVHWPAYNESREPQRHDPSDTWEHCPEALLASRIVTAQSVGIVNPDELEKHIQEIYQMRDYLYHSGRVDEHDFTVWGIANGISMAHELYDHVMEYVKPFTATMVMKFCSWIDGRGQVQDMSWAQDPGRFRYAEDINLHAYVIKDAAKCDVKFEDFARFDRFRSVTVSQFEHGQHSVSGAYEECSAFFHFIVENYDQLPDFVIFSHADAPEHQGTHLFALNLAMAVISKGRRLADVLGYYPLSTFFVVDAQRAHVDIFHDLWYKLFGTDYYDELARQEECVVYDSNGVVLAGNVTHHEPCDKGLSFHIANQAIVSRERIRQRPREFYENALRVAFAGGNPYSGHLEGILHVIFGERIVGTFREKDTRLPAGLRWLIPGKAIFNPE